MDVLNQSDIILFDICRLFCDEKPISFESINTSRDDLDFREVMIPRFASGNKFVIKLSDNDFTFSEKIKMWKRTVEEYQKLGYYCPAIISDKTGNYPMVNYKGHKCIAYAEEYSPYHTAEERMADSSAQGNPFADAYEQEIWTMTAKIAAKHLDYTEYPSAYCLFDTFCPSDETDEVLDNALNWKAYAQTLPDHFQEQVQRIWKLWTENRTALEPIYRRLPTSIFQADLNPTNILIDDSGKFVGVCDFNLCGKDVFINYLFRELYHSDFEKEVEMIRRILKIASKYYPFSELEKNTALMLYRCLKPLWFTKTEKLRKLNNDSEAVKAYLNETERSLTEPVEFSFYMG